MRLEKARKNSADNLRGFWAYYDKKGAFCMETGISGYCRTLDGPRLVLLEAEPGQEPEADCDYPDCPYAAVCTVAAQLRSQWEEAT